MPKRPWNRVNLPVYATSTHDGDAAHNMHIITYANAVSMQPKQFIIALYYGTKSLALVQQHQYIVLQLLSEHQYRLVDILGKQSGHNINKIQRLQKRQLLSTWKGFWVLKEALAYMHLTLTPLQANDPSVPAPDHMLYLGTLTDFKHVNEGNALTLDTLRTYGLIRI
ncbi:MAG TPA: hypothetical protein DCL43_08465 [Chitinophagaceae bacterium]|nr:hypothetical protein [Chitinophagaceae bacterium]HAN39310.1 hypothetical protein [Chitinophagaceae bacterium]